MGGRVGRRDPPGFENFVFFGQQNRKNLCFLGYFGAESMQMKTLRPPCFWILRYGEVARPPCL
jgi:hypothetical protein